MDIAVIEGRRQSTACSQDHQESAAIRTANVGQLDVQAGLRGLPRRERRAETDHVPGAESVKLLNRQALPDAGTKIGGHYRRLQKRGAETVPAFLIREDKVHDEMIRALQRLLRQKEVSFDGYEVTLDELKAFCGFKPGASLWYGEDDVEEDTASQAASEQGSARTATPQPAGAPSRPTSPSTAASSKTNAKGKDLIDRLMSKGLLPLAALDVIRGWLLLEMAVTTEEDRRLIRSGQARVLRLAHRFAVYVRGTGR